MQADLAGLDSPQYQAEALRDDINPRRLQEVDEALADPRHQAPIQQQMLGDEKQRLQAVQAQWMQHMAQQFPQRLAQSLNLQQHTGMPSPGPEAFMAKLMLQMQRRYPGMGGVGGPTAP